MDTNALLFGFYSYETEIFVEAGINVKACISVMEKGERPDSSKYETHDHAKVARCLVDGAPQDSFSPKLKHELYSRAFPLFRRHYHRVAYYLTSSLRSWTNTDHQFHLAAHFFFDLLKRNKITTVVFSNFPHEGSAIILYELAQILGIGTIICTQSLFSNKLWIVRTIDDFGNFSSVAGEGASMKPPKAPETPFYMKNLKRARKWKEAASVGKQAAKLALKIIGLQFIFDLDSWDRSIARLVGTVDSNSIGNPGPRYVSKVKLDEPFIYFPLHYQPELTTDTWAEKYGDQLSALEELAQAVPPGVSIYVKENPVQGRFMREPSFFRRLRRIPNAKYISSEVPTFELIRKCMCVATITGTAGWEALLLGKSAIIFGVTWYSQLPGVFQWRDGETVAEALAFRPDPALLETAFERLSAKLYSGVVDKAYAEIVSGFERGAGAMAAARAVKSVIQDHELRA